MRAVLALIVLTGVAGCAHHPDRPDPPDPPCDVHCQEQSAEDAVRRAYASRALAGRSFTFEQEARDLDAVRREFCFKAAMAITDLPRQVAAVKACREEWPIPADTTVEVK